MRWRARCDAVTIPEHFVVVDPEGDSDEDLEARVRRDWTLPAR